jgi:glycosyltransferase involved in cell wall biosynthesis
VTRPNVAVIIAAYNESRQVGRVVADVLPRCHLCIVVDDGSLDTTGVEAHAAGAIVLRHAINRGQGAAVLTGIQYALSRGADVVVTFDADGQHDPNDIPAIVAPIVEGRVDIALGSRFIGRTEGMPVLRRILLRGAILFTRAFSAVRVTDAHNGVRALSRRAAGELTITLDGMAHASEIVDQIRVHQWRFVEVPTVVRYSDYSLQKGQSAFNSIRIVVQLILHRLGD